MPTYGDIAFKTYANNDKVLKGLGYPVRLGNTGGMFSRVDDIQALKASLIQLILTRRGERVMMPSFGTDIRETVFQPLDDTTVASIHSQVVEAINTYMPGIIVQSLEVTPHMEHSTLSIKLVFSAKEEVLGSERIEITVSTKGFSIG